MKKSKPVFAILLCGLALGMVPLINNINHGIVEKARALTVTGELNGGAKTTYQASALNTSEQYFVATLVQNSNSGNNFYVRIKNYNSYTVDVHVIMESVNGHASQVKSNGKYVLYAPNGTQLEEKISSSGRYVTLPAKFNGIFSLASLQLADVPEWDQGETSKDVKNIKAIHFGVIAQSENITLEIGDVFTNDLLNLDASSLNNEEFVIKDFKA